MPFVEASKFDVHQGIATISVIENIKFLLDFSVLKIPHHSSQFGLHLKVNIDGVPLFKSSRINLLPILMIVNDCYRPVPFWGKNQGNLIYWNIYQNFAMNSRSLWNKA
jgi:hypothetical protein